MQAVSLFGLYRETTLSAVIAKSEVEKLVEAYELPAEIPFGVELAPIMFTALFEDGAWQSGSLVPFGDVPVNPAATALQFGQQAFEGMKAYKGAHATPVLFRPDMNWQRLGRSARRLKMPEVPAELFARALSALATTLQAFVPAGRGQSLYLRPTLFGLDPHFALRGSDRYMFLVIASPSDAYYSDSIRIMIERNDRRAAPGGTGAEKVGGNYAASLLANERCVAKGYDQSLWLDPDTGENIEELSAMNIVAVIDGQLHTPAPSGSLLEGVTRDSMLQLAPQLGLEGISRTMPINELIADIEAGRCSELFACGTGAIVSPIKAVGEANGQEWTLPKVGVVAEIFRDALLNIQEGTAEDPFGWTVGASDAVALEAFLRSGSG